LVGVSIISLMTTVFLIGVPGADGVAFAEVLMVVASSHMSCTSSEPKKTQRVSTAPLLGKYDARVRGKGADC
jgi:transcriptional regulator of nitric oxide reductase